MGPEEGLAVKQDAVGNIIIKKPATPGMENRKGVVLQAHIDMVPRPTPIPSMILPKIPSMPI